MSSNNSVYKLNEILLKTDEELVSNWSRLASLIKNYEKMEWRAAQQLASQLMQDGKANEYVAKVRAKTSAPKKKTNTPKKKTTSTKKGVETKAGKSIKKKQTKVVPINTRRDRFSMNYKRLLEIAPDLIERLERGEEVYGKSIKTGYDDFNLELIHTDKTGYYLALSHYYEQNGDLVPDPDMQILVDPEMEVIQALAFQNAMYYREVYNDIYNRKLVNPQEKKAQNAFLEQWLKNLIAQDQLIAWKHDEDDSEKKSSDVAVEKPDISYMDNKVIATLKEFAEKIILDEAISLYTKHKDSQLNLKPIALYFIIERINNSPISDNNLPYPSEAELKLNYSKLENFKSQEKKIDELNGLDKPDISFIPEALDKALRGAIEKSSLKAVEKSFEAHQNEKLKLNPLSLFYVIERLNRDSAVYDVPYPTEKELKRFFETLKPEGYDKAFSELGEEFEKMKAFVSPTKIFEQNYVKLLDIFPSLENELKRNDELLGASSKSKESENQFNLVLEENMNGGYVLSLLESSGDGDDYVFGSMMKVHCNPTIKELRALSTFSGNADVVHVYEKPDTFELTNTKVETEQNKALGEWLIDLKNEGHKIEKLTSIKEVGINNNTFDPLEKGRKVEKRNINEAKPVDSKPDKKSTNTTESSNVRQEKVRQNQVLKTNFQKLIRLAPDLLEMELMQSSYLVSLKNDIVLSFNLSDKKGDFAQVFEIVEQNSQKKKWTVHVQPTTEKVFVKTYETTPKGVLEISSEKRNADFGKWLSKKLKLGYKKIDAVLDLLLKKHPIIIEWTEGTDKKSISFNSIEELEIELKSYGLTDKPKETYIKNKVWFRGYKTEVSIGLSEIKGDYNPKKQDLIEWLTSFDPEFDWEQFIANPKKKSRKELQKAVKEIPDFKVGEVQLVAAHTKAGIKQKHINWINKHKQGMTVTPIKRMVNNTADFYADSTQKALKPGFRISATGKLYYETRSNRSDMTGAGL